MLRATTHRLYHGGRGGVENFFEVEMLRGVGSIALGDKERNGNEVDLCESREMTLGRG